MVRIGRLGRRLTPSPRALLASVGGLCLALGAGQSSGEDPAPAIVRIALRDYTITLESGVEGPRYTVESREGGRLAEAASEAELASRHPELWRRLRGLLAGPARGDASFAWAGE